MESCDYIISILNKFQIICHSKGNVSNSELSTTDQLSGVSNCEGGYWQGTGTTGNSTIVNQPVYCIVQLLLQDIMHDGFRRGQVLAFMVTEKKLDTMNTTDPPN